MGRLRQHAAIADFCQNLNDAVSMPSLLDKPVACLKLKICDLVTNPKDSASSAFSCNWIVQLFDVTTCTIMYVLTVDRDCSPELGQQSFEIWPIQLGAYAQNCQSLLVMACDAWKYGILPSYSCQVRHGPRREPESYTVEKEAVKHATRQFDQIGRQWILWSDGYVALETLETREPRDNPRLFLISNGIPWQLRWKWPQPRSMLSWCRSWMIGWLPLPMCQDGGKRQTANGCKWLEYVGINGNCSGMSWHDCLRMCESLKH